MVLHGILATDLTRRQARKPETLKAGAAPPWNVIFT
jgi:hypothetical protein